MSFWNPHPSTPIFSTYWALSPMKDGAHDLLSKQNVGAAFCVLNTLVIVSYSPSIQDGAQWTLCIPVSQMLLP